MNTAAVNDPDLVFNASSKVGSQCIVVAIYAKQTAPGKLHVFTHGGRNNTGMDAVDWAKRVEMLGAGEILLTSMDRDGTKNGFDLALTRAVSDAVKIPVIAFQGLPARICWLGLGQRHLAGLAFNEMVAHGLLHHCQHCFQSRPALDA